MSDNLDTFMQNQGFTSLEEALTFCVNEKKSLGETLGSSPKSKASAVFQSQVILDERIRLLSGYITEIKRRLGTDQT